jgi:hypothetical protein
MLRVVQVREFVAENTKDSSGKARFIQVGVEIQLPTMLRASIARPTLVLVCSALDEETMSNYDIPQLPQVERLLF